MRVVGRLVGGAAFRRLFRRQRLVGELGHAQPIGELQCRLDGVGEPGREVGPHDDAVDHHVDVVLVFLVQRRNVGDLVEDAVDLDALETLLCSSSSSLRYSPLRPRTMGASR